MADGKLQFLIDYDTQKADKNINTSQKKLSGFAKAAVAAFSVTAVVNFTKEVTGLASEMEEIQNKFDVVFKGMEKDAEDWAEQFSKSVGRSRKDTKEFLSNIADLTIGMGMTQDASFDLATQIVELGTDLASFNNLQDSQAIEALTKAMLGEAEAAKQLGLLLNVDRVKEFAEAQGLVYKNLTDAEKAQLTFNLAVSQSQNAIGDAERSSESYANQVKAMEAAMEDLKIELGNELLPVMLELVQLIKDDVVPVLSDMLEWLFKGEDGVDHLGEAFTALEGAGIVVLLSKISGGIAAIGAAFGVALAPMMLFFGALFAGAVDAIKHWDDFVSEIQFILSNMLMAVQQLTNFILSGINLVINDTLFMIEGLINSVITKINALISVINLIPGVKEPLIPKIDFNEVNLRVQQYTPNQALSAVAGGRTKATIKSSGDAPSVTNVYVNGKLVNSSTQSDRGSSVRVGGVSFQ